MGKYTPLGGYLGRQPPQEPVTMTFREIERLVGILPASARTYREWWGNQRNSQAQAAAWMSVGRTVESVDLQQQRVRFSPSTRASLTQHPVTEEVSLRPDDPADRAAEVSTDSPEIRSGPQFEVHARQVLEREWGLTLPSRVIEVARGVTHSFDLVSADLSVVGDAKWFKNIGTPAAKWSVIAEYVWLLQRLERPTHRFLVFGQDRAVPERWLARFRPLAEGVEFLFLAGDEVEPL